MISSRAPSESHREIERKFLVKQLPENLERYQSRLIEQGYLAAKRDGTQVRLRKAGARLSLAFKEGNGIERREVEVDLIPEQFDPLWAATAGRRLSKTRYDIPFGEFTIEVDVYGGSNAGLVVAEVEFDDEKQYADFQPPDWFGREVSGKARYSNVKLARE